MERGGVVKRTKAERKVSFGFRTIRKPTLSIKMHQGAPLRRKVSFRVSRNGRRRPEKESRPRFRFVSPPVRFPSCRNDQRFNELVRYFIERGSVEHRSIEPERNIAKHLRRKEKEKFLIRRRGSVSTTTMESGSSFERVRSQWEKMVEGGRRKERQKNERL